MLEKEPARSAEAKPKGKAEAAPRVKKKIVAAPTTRTAAGKPVAPRQPREYLHERIQRRAYELWEREGRPAGREHAHWLQAESEVSRARGHHVGVSR